MSYVENEIKWEFDSCDLSNSFEDLPDGFQFITVFKFGKIYKYVNNIIYTDNGQKTSKEVGIINIINNV